MYTPEVSSPADEWEPVYEMQPSLSSINEGLGLYGCRRNQYGSCVGPGQCELMLLPAEAQPTQIYGQYSAGSIRCSELRRGSNTTTHGTNSVRTCGEFKRQQSSKGSGQDKYS
jgi:hypothetical protein